VIERPAETEFAPAFARYVNRVGEADALVALESQIDDLRELVAGIPAERETFRYAEAKWSVREMFGHLTDTERVIGHRAFCIGRGEQASLPGFDENTYVANANGHERTLAQHLEEFLAVRASNLIFLRSVDAETTRRIGTANGSPASVRAMAFVLVGHVRHHMNVLQTKYGIPG
jgi:hypothetical protein